MYLRYLDCRLALCNELLLAGSNLKGKRKREKGKRKREKENTNIQVRTGDLPHVKRT